MFDLLGDEFFNGFIDFSHQLVKSAPLICLPGPVYPDSSPCCFLSRTNSYSLLYDLYFIPRADSEEDLRRQNSISPLGSIPSRIVSVVQL
jgi:hypothetical protein